MIDFIENTLEMDDIVKYLKVDRLTITRWVKTKSDFPRPFKIGRKNLWKKSEIDAYLETKRKTGD